MADFYVWLRRNKRILLLACWACGLVVSFRVALSMKNLLPSLVHSTITQGVTLWTALWSACCPVLLTSFAVRYGRLGVLPVAFFHGLRFGFSGFTICLVYGQSGWLIQLLFLFYDYALIPCLYLLWLRLLTVQGNHNRGYAVVFAYSILVGLFQFRIISPFLSGLF